MDSPRLESWYAELQGMLQSLLAVSHPQVCELAAHAHALIAHEIRRGGVDDPLQSQDAVFAHLARLPDVALRDIRCRCIYYASQDLITALAHRRIRNSAIAREEAILYVQDRLQRDDFRRIETFDAATGASIKTYLWQVVTRLLIDFVRSRKSSTARPLDDDEAFESEDLESGAAAAEHQLQDMLRGVFAAHGANLDNRRSLRERLRERLQLTSRERLFLKALFQYDMSIEEIRALPGFTMSSGEAWRFYYRILDRLLETFKQADALEDLHGLIDASAPKLTLQLEQRTVEVVASNIHYVKALDADSSGCEATWQGLLVRARIGDSLARLKKRLAPWFSPVNATTLIADKWLAAAAERWNDERFEAVEIPGVVERFPIGRAQRAVLAHRYAPKKSAGDSYIQPRTDDEPPPPEARR